MTGFVLDMTLFVLYMTGSVLCLTELILDMTGFVINLPCFFFFKILWNWFLIELVMNINLFVLNTPGFVLDMTEFLPIYDYCKILSQICSVFVFFIQSLVTRGLRVTSDTSHKWTGFARHDSLWTCQAWQPLVLQDMAGPGLARHDIPGLARYDSPVGWSSSSELIIAVLFRPEVSFN